MYRFKIYKAKIYVIVRTNLKKKITKTLITVEKNFLQKENKHVRIDKDNKDIEKFEKQNNEVDVTVILEHNTPKLELFF